MNLIAITGSEISGYASLLVTVIGAISLAVVKIINARRDAVIEIEKQRQANENSAKIAALEAAHEGSVQAISTLNAAVQNHDAQLTTVALTTVPADQAPTKFQ